MGDSSVVIITKNNEEYIEGCIKSVNWSDEIIIVDGLSSDKTVEIARKYTDKIFFKEMTAGFGPQYQYAVDQATKKWILSIDVDERVSPLLAEEIQNIINQDNCDAMAVYIIGNFLGKIIGDYQGRFEKPCVRIFKKSKGRFNEARIHARVQADGKIIVLRNPLIHLGPYNDIKQFFQKINLYTSLDVDELIKKGVVIRPRGYIWFFILKSLAVFFQKFFLKRMFKKGIYGFLFSAFRAISYFMMYAKLWERQKKLKGEINELEEFCKKTKTPL